MAIAKKGSLGSGGAPFFKPADHVNDAALIIEPRTIRKNVRTGDKNDDGSDKLRDEVVALVIAFKNETSALEGRPFQNGLQTFTNSVLVKDLERFGIGTGDAVIVKLRQWQIPNSRNKAWVFNEDDVPDDVRVAVTAFYEKRESEVAKAIEDAPDFD